jgi:1,4-dihydroxy-2-naphthoyl-CoA synthase
MAETFRERVVRTEDAKEGPQAFMEKRTPRFTGE